MGVSEEWAPHYLNHSPFQHFNLYIIYGKYRICFIRQEFQVQYIYTPQCVLRPSLTIVSVDMIFINTKFL